MTDTLYLCLSILTMALVTYLVRMLPLAAIRRKITSPFVLSFLYYVPYAVLRLKSNKCRKKSMQAFCLPKSV